MQEVCMMPTAGKLFIHVEDLDLDAAAESLSSWRESEVYETPDDRYDLLTNVEEVEHDGEELRGIFMYDDIATYTWRGVLSSIPYTKEAPFVFTKQEEKWYLIVMAPKAIANRTANILSTILHGEQGFIVEPMIRSDNFDDFQKGTDATKIMFFDEIETPNLDKATLYGGNVHQTDFFGNLVSVGRPWYVVGKTKQRGWTVGIVRDGAVVVFNTIDATSFVEFVKDKIIPMTYRRSRG
jgi:hypothetical protein